MLRLCTHTPYSAIALFVATFLVCSLETAAQVPTDTLHTEFGCDIHRSPIDTMGEGEFTIPGYQLAVANSPSENMIEIEDVVQNHGFIQSYKINYRGNRGYIDNMCLKEPETGQIRYALDNYARFDSLRSQGFELFLEEMRYPKDHTDGISFVIGFQNISRSRSMRYIDFYVSLYNGVGDRVGGSKRVRGIGPIRPGERGFYAFGPEWYSSSGSCVEIDRIIVTHTDGHRFTYINDLDKIRKDDINPLFDSDIILRGECPRY